MSEIRVTTLKDTSGGNSSTTAQVFSGRAKAWVNFNGSGAVAIRANFNVNSIGDNGTGNYQINFSTSMSDANYTVAGNPSDDNVASTYLYVQGSVGGTYQPLSSDFRIYVLADNVGPADRTWVALTVHR